MSLRFSNRGLEIRATDIIKISTYNKTAAFTLSLTLTLAFNYSDSFSDELIKNELLPSVKDTIAGFYPNKSIFQILIALQSCFQLILNIILFVTLGGKGKVFKIWGGLVNFLRYISLLGFTIITFADDPNAFNNFYVLHLLANFGWIYLLDAHLKSPAHGLNQKRRIVSYAYGSSLMMATIFFYKHQVVHSRYAYSVSALFQWSMIYLDIYSDSELKNELKHVFFRVDFPEGNPHKHIV